MYVRKQKALRGRRWRAICFATPWRCLCHPLGEILKPPLYMYFWIYSVFNIDKLQHRYRTRCRLWFISRTGVHNNPVCVNVCVCPILGVLCTRMNVEVEVTVNTRPGNKSKMTSGICVVIYRWYKYMIKDVYDFFIRRKLEHNQLSRNLVDKKEIFTRLSDIIQEPLNNMLLTIPW